MPGEGNRPDPRHFEYGCARHSLLETRSKLEREESLMDFSRLDPASVSSPAPPPKMPKTTTIYDSD